MARTLGPRATRSWSPASTTTPTSPRGASPLPTAGRGCRTVDFDPADGTLDLDAFAAALGPRTRLVAVTAASNALGTVPPMRAAHRDLAHAAGALVYVDAVHFSAHRLLSMRQPSTPISSPPAPTSSSVPTPACVVANPEHLAALDPYKVVPAPELGPGRWETGTQSFESLAGVAAAVDYLASLGSGENRRRRLEQRLRLDPSP